MTVYWKDVKRGQNLVLSDEEGHEEVIGGFRDTQRGIDAYAQTFSYEPGRSQNGFATIEDAKDFVGEWESTIETERGTFTTTYVFTMDGDMLKGTMSGRMGETEIDDLVQGRVSVANDQLDDMVLLRADGTPTYMLSVVVDEPQPARDRDAEFKIEYEDTDSLIAMLETTADECLALISKERTVDWSAVRSHWNPEQDLKVSAAWAIMHALEHLREHVGEIALTRHLWDAR